MQTLSKEIISFLQCIPRAIILALILIPAYLFLQENGNKAKEKIIAIKKQKWQLAFLLYGSLILTSAIFARPITNPYDSIFANFGFFDENGINPEIIINILLFIPLTFLYIQAYKPLRPIRSALVLSVVTTLFMELFQLLFWLGRFQLSDIIHNVMGGLIGGCIWWAVTQSKEKQLFARISAWISNHVRRKD